MEDATPSPEDLILYAALFGSEYKNSVPSVEGSRSARAALLTGRELVAGTLHALSRVASAPEVAESPSLVGDALTGALDQLSFLSRLQSAILPSAIEEDVKRLASKLQASAESATYMHSRAEGLIDTFESQSTRADAFRARTHAARRLLVGAADQLGLPIAPFERGQVRRSIVFPPELKQAAVGVLSYFSEVLEQKYPGMDVAVAISQDGDRVTMVVTTPEGREEQIDRELGEYGLVMAGQLAPADYLEDPLHVVRLEHKLEMASLELRHTRDLLASEREHYGARLQSLEGQVSFLTDVLDSDRQQLQVLVSALREVASSAVPAASELLTQAADLLSSSSPAVPDQETVALLATAANEDPTIVDRLNELLIRGAVQGAAGNFLYSWIQTLINVLK